MDILDINIDRLYENKLNMSSFIQMLDSPTQCYKFYWLEAIVTLLPDNDKISFKSIIIEMLWEAWYTVTEYHLRLGPAILGKEENYIEHAIHVLKGYSSSVVSKDAFIDLVEEHFLSVKADFDKLILNVPYRLQSSFIPEIGGNDKLWDQRTRLITYMEEINNHNVLPYLITHGRGLNKSIIINSAWKQVIMDNYSIIKGWIQMKKVHYLQDRNPGVPGIIYKLGYEQHTQRKLEKVRNLWMTYTHVTGRPIIGIYDNLKLSKENFSLDHFVPWSYISNDELWNLTPMSKSLNSSKGNKLPEWNRFFYPLGRSQYLLYKGIFHEEKIRNQFEKCRVNNLSSLWAEEYLYVPGNTEEQFMNILEKNLKPIYENAKLQGFQEWIIS